MKFDDKYETARPYLVSFIILRREDKIAMTLRQNTGWMDGFYGVPAGKIEWQETFRDGVIREALEEVGVTIKPSDLKLVHTAHRHGEDEKVFMDWVDLYFEAATWEGEPHNAEPEKSDQFEWLELSNLPKNIVPSQRAALTAIAEGQNYSEFGWSISGE